MKFWIFLNGLMLGALLYGSLSHNQVVFTWHVIGMGWLLMLVYKIGVLIGELREQAAAVQRRKAGRR
jgi:hypothetical protein